jgi:PAS domain S-box-containing protein
LCTGEPLVLTHSQYDKVVVDLADLASSNKKSAIHVLHVDDDPSLQEITKLMLLDLDNSFEIDCACCVDEGLSKLAAGHYDVVVSDYEMPQKDGLQFLKELRENNNKVSFILFTGKGREEVAIQALNSGADGYFNKQGSPETVYGELAHGIKQSVRQKKTDIQLRETLEILERVGEDVGAGLAVISRDYNVVWANKRLMALGVAFNKKCYQTFNRLETVCPDCGVQKIFSQNLSLDVHEFRTVDSNGETVWVELRVTPLKDKDGNVTAALELAVPITERKKAEQESATEHALVQQVINSTDSLIFSVDKNYCYTSFNRAHASVMKAIYGVDIQVDKSILDYMTVTIDQEKAKHNIDKALGGEKLTEESYSGDAQLSRNYFIISHNPLRDSKGEVTGVVVVSNDITERKKSEEILAFSERKYREFANSLPEIVFESDDKGMLTFVNRKALEIMGYSSDEVKHLNIFQCLASSDRQRAKENVQNRMRGVITVGNEYLVLKKDGVTFPGMIFTEKIVTEEGKVGLRGVIVNITQTKKTEEALRDSEEKHRKLYEESLDAIFLADAETGILIDCNKAALEFVGRTKLEIVGQHQRILHPAHEIEGDAARAFKQHQKQDGVNEVQVITKTGEIKDVSIKSSHVVVGDRKVLQGVFRDVTENKKVQNALLVSEEKYRETIQNANIGVVAYRSDGEITILNPTMQKMTGYTIEEIPRLSQWFEKLFPNEMERQKIKDIWFKKLTDVGEVKEGQATIITKQGEERIFLFDGFRLLSGDFIAFARDITDRVKAEEALNVVMDQLVLVNEKLGVVGSLTRHDVGNKLMAAKSNLYLLKKRIGDNPDLAKYLDGIDCALASSSEIFEFSRLYERIGVEKASKENVFDCFNQAVSLIPNLNNLEVVNECQGLVVVADSLLKQLLYNFIDNSIKHGGKVTQIRLHYSKDGDELKLFYEDNGVGIPEANKSRLFDSGFTTGNGSGLGLYLIKKMMDVYGWTITENGEPGKGAKFVMATPKLNKSGKENYQLTQ